MQERRLGVAMTDLADAQKVLDEKQAELDAVQATYDAAMKSKQVSYKLLLYVIKKVLWVFYFSNSYFNERRRLCIKC